MAIILPANTLSTGGYEVANSCRFQDSDSAEMSRAIASTGSNTIWTVSAWVKRVELGQSSPIFGTGDGNADNDARMVFFDAADAIECSYYNSGYTYEVTTNRLFRDVSAWYHICILFDSTQGTAANRIKIYVNGTQETSFATSSYPSEDAAFNFGNTSYTHYVNDMGGRNIRGSHYIAELVYIDGTASAVTNFGEFDSDSPTIWKPIDVSGLTFGTNGFYLDFEDSANLGNDANGGTDLTEVNLAATDQTTDTPTNNFCTMNPLDIHTSATLSEGNTQITTAANGWFGSSGTMGITLGSGPWYFEAKAITSTRLYFGLSRIGQGVRGVCLANSEVEGSASFDYMWRATAANTVFYGGSDQSITIAAISANDICACHVATDGEVKFYVNDSVVVTFSTKLVAGYFYFPILAVNEGGTSTAETWQANFGSPAYANSSSQSDAAGYGDFEFATKSGYAINTKNLGSDGG